MSQTTITRRSALESLGVTGAIGLSKYTSGAKDAAQHRRETVSAAWVYIAEVSDPGWSWAHDQARKTVANEFDWLETTSAEAVDPANAERILTQYTQQGYDVIFGTTFDYMDPMYRVAKQHPETVYEHCSGYKTRQNMGRYFGRIYQTRYLTGVAAGLVTEENSLGYVAAFPIPEVVRGINAFTLGARSVNDEVTTTVSWTNTWLDPAKETEAAHSLIEAGVDVMAQHQDSPAAVEAANAADIWATGYNAPMGEFGDENYLTSPIWHWAAFYAPTLEAVRNGNWKADFYWEGLDAEIVGLSDWGPQVPKEVKDTVQEKRTAIESDEFDVWDNSKFAEKDETFLFQKMNSYVTGVEGEVPQ